MCRQRVLPATDRQTDGPRQTLSVRDLRRGLTNINEPYLVTPVRMVTKRCTVYGMATSTLVLATIRGRVKNDKNIK